MNSRVCLVLRWLINTNSKTSKRNIGCVDLGEARTRTTVSFGEICIEVWSSSFARDVGLLAVQHWQGSGSRLVGWWRWSGVDCSRWADGGLKTGLSSWWGWTTKLEVASMMGSLLVMEASGGADFLWIWIVIWWDEKHSNDFFFIYFSGSAVRLQIDRCLVWYRIWHRTIRTKLKQQ